MRVCAAIALVIGSALVTAQSPAAPDLVLINGKVFTADPAVPEVEAIGIRGSVIVARGANAAVRDLATPKARIIDVGGRVVIPGINDAHTHVGARPEGVVLDLKGMDPSLDEVIKAIRDVAPKAPAGRWIYGTVGERVLSDPAATRAALDRAAPDRRIKLAAWTGHGTLLSTPGLQALDIGEHERDPLFGRYARNEDGTLTGLLEEYADIQANRRMALLAGRAASLASLRKLTDEAIGYGVTTIQAMGNSIPAADLASMLAEINTPLRWRVIRFPVAVDERNDPGSLGAIPKQYANLVTVSGVKWILDGTPIERLSAMNEAYTDRADWTGRLNLSPEEIEKVLRRSLEGGDQVLLHATGDRTIELVLKTMERLATGTHWQTLRPRIEHGEFVSGQRIVRAARLGVVVVQNPSHFTIGDLLRTRLGPERAAETQVMKALIAGKVHVALGADGPLNPFLNMMFAITHPANPEQAMTREQVIAAYTTGSAYAEFAEKEKGSLTPGKVADIAVLSQDIFSVDPEKLPQTRAVVTIANGRILRDEITKSRPSVH